MNSTPNAQPVPASAHVPAMPPARLAFQARLMVAAVALASLAVVFWPHDTGKRRAEVAGGAETGAQEGGSTQGGGFLLDAQGRAATLGGRLAPVTLLHFWATWCPPCIAEAPSLARLARDFAARRDFGIVMVAVADSRDRVGAFLGSGAEMVLYDPKWDVAHRYGTEKLPETYLVVRGKVVDKFIGETDWDAREVRQRLAAHLQADAGSGSGAGS